MNHVMHKLLKLLDMLMSGIARTPF